MAKGILLVESGPASPDQIAEYHEWYNETHVDEILGVEGFVSARRLESIDEPGTFIAIYEIEADDLDAARTRLRDSSGNNTPPVGVRLDPPPIVRYFAEIAAFPRA